MRREGSSWKLIANAIVTPWGQMQPTNARLVPAPPRYLARAQDEAADAPPKQVVARLGAAWLAAYRGDRDRCERYADACAKVAAEMDYPAYVAMGEMLGGWARAMSGVPGAVDALDAAYTRYVSDGTRLNAPVYLALRAEAHAFIGDVDTARRLVADAGSIPALTGEQCLGPRLTALGVRLAGPLPSRDTAAVAHVPSSERSETGFPPATSRRASTST